MEALSQEPGNENDVPWPGRSPGQGRRGVPLASRLSPGASPVRQALGPPGLWPPTFQRSLGPGLGLGHSGTQGQDCQEQVALGEGPAASPGGRGKCYFCLLLSSGTGCPGRGGQRRPLRLSPAHREFSKDARGCGRVADVAEAGGPGPQTHHHKGGG